jgi:hypothetical protein
MRESFGEFSPQGRGQGEGEGHDINPRLHFYRKSMPQFL